MNTIPPTATKRPVVRVFVGAAVALAIGVAGIILLTAHVHEPASQVWHLWGMAIVGTLGGLYFLVAGIRRALLQRTG